MRLNLSNYFSTLFSQIMGFCIVFSKKIHEWFTGKYKYWFISISLLVFIYVIYFIFAFESSLSSTGNYDFFKTPIISTSYGIFAACTIYVFYEIYKQKLNAKKILLIILGLGIWMRIAYSIYTPIYFNGGTWRQHDLSFGVDATRLYPGHYSIIMFIFRNNAWPNMLTNADGTINWATSSQLYQPKFFHTIMALFMKFNSLFIHTSNELMNFSTNSGNIINPNQITVNEYVLFEMNRVLTCYISCLTLLIGYNILKSLNFSKTSCNIGTALIAFSPIFYIFSTLMNNDLLSVFFVFLSVLIVIKWYKQPSYFKIILLALSIGCAMSSKLSAGFVAIFVGALIIVRLFKSLKYKELGQKSSLNIFLSILVFAAIVFPLGLSYPIYAKIKFNQPFTYVWEISKTNWNAIDPSFGFFERFFIYPSPDFFKTIFVDNRGYISHPNIYPGIQVNVWSYVLKSSLFGEYYISVNSAGVFYAIGLILFTLFICLLIYLLVDMIKYKLKNVNWMNFAVIVLIGLAFISSYIVFNINYPFTCTMHFRYIVPILIVGAVILATSYDKLNLIKHNGVAIIAKNSIIVTITLFAILSILTYLNV